MITVPAWLFVLIIFAVWVFLGWMFADLIKHWDD